MYIRYKFNYELKPLCNSTCTNHYNFEEKRVLPEVVRPSNKLKGQISPWCSYLKASLPIMYFYTLIVCYS